jgi:predicted metalloprotease
MKCVLVTNEAQTSKTGAGAVVLALLAFFLRGTPGQIDVPQTQSGPSAGAPASAGEDPQVKFVSAVLADTEKTWHDIFRTEIGHDYVEPKLVLFTDAVQSGCGVAQSAFHSPEL